VDQSAPLHPLAAVLERQERSGAWLARKTGKSVSYVSYVIAGQRRPSADFKAQAATVLGVPQSLLFPADEAVA
jgi:hypothetical protein